LDRFIDLFNDGKINGTELAELILKGRDITELDTARAAVTDYLKGFNINDAEQVRHMAQLKNTVQELEEKAGK
jgi:hypothetical protein